MAKTEKSGSNKKLIVIIILVILLVLVLAGGLVAYLFLNSPKVKVARAIANTFDGAPQIVEDLRAHPITTEDYSVTTDVDLDLNTLGELGLKLDVDADDTGKSATGSVDLPFVKGVKVNAELTDQKLLVEVPLLKDTLLAYDYTQENNGMIADYVDTESLNQVLAFIYKVDLGGNGILGSYESDDTADSDADDSDADNSKLVGFQADVIEVLYTFYADVEFHKIKAQEFEVNGDEEKCVGYSTVLDDSQMSSLITDLEDIFTKYEIDTTDATGVSTEEFFQKMQDKADELGETELDFYIYDNALAAMEITTEKSQINLLLQGGDYRWQNTTLTCNDDLIFELTGDLTEEKECMSFYTGLTLSEDATPYGVSYQYGLDDGTLQVALLDENRKETDSISGSLTFDDEEGYIHLSLDSYEAGGCTLSGSLTIKEKGDVDHLSGDEIDVGNMTKEEYEAVVADFMKNKLGGLGSLLDIIW